MPAAGDETAVHALGRPDRVEMKDLGVEALGKGDNLLLADGQRAEEVDPEPGR